MSRAPWSKEQAEQRAKEWARGVYPNSRTYAVHETYGYDGFLAGVAWAAEMIEKCPTVYSAKPDGVSECWVHSRCDGHDTHQAKLVGAKPIEKGIKK